MNIISLITDFGLTDNFVGAIKAAILKINPRAQIVDICHEVKPQDITQAAFLLRGAFRYFSPDSVHLAVVDPRVGSQRKKIIVRTKDYYFVAPDNGILGLALKDEPPIEVVDITNDKYFLKPASDTFHGRDIFAPVAAYISKGKNIREFGQRIKSIRELKLPEVRQAHGVLTGEVIYIDRFGNLISNIDKNMLYNFIGNKKIKIFIKNKTIDKLSRSYCAVSQLKPVALIDSFDYLEIAINGGSAKDSLGVDKGAKISIKIC